MPEKICVICGEDCSTRPRTKDPKGRYYCNACYEAARAGKSSAAARSGPADPPDDVFGLENDDNMALDMIEEIAPAQPAAAGGPAAVPCPGCGVATPAGTVLCTSCGYNMQTGRSAKVKTRHFGASLSEMTIGLSGKIDAMTFALGGLAVYVVLMLVGMATAGSDATMVMLHAWHWIFMWTYAIIVLVAAFRMSIIQGLLVFFVPCYVFYFILITESQWARWMFVTAFLGIVIYVVMVLNYSMPEPFMPEQLR